MTEPALDKSRYGDLLWPRFFGPSVEYARSSYNRYVMLTMTVLASGLFLATGILLIWGGTDPRWGTLNVAIAIGIPVFYWYLRGQAQTSLEYEPLRDRGGLDWDLYENGMLTREYAEDLPGRVRTAFVPWAGLSKAYLTITDRNAPLVWELARASARKARNVDGGVFLEPDFVLDERARALLSRFVWLVSGETGTADLRLDRGQLSDPARFEAILRRKLKEVE
jgi:hypothetical protein